MNHFYHWILLAEHDSRLKGGVKKINNRPKTKYILDFQCVFSSYRVSALILVEKLIYLTNLTVILVSIQHYHSL